MGLLTPAVLAIVGLVYLSCCAEAQACVSSDPHPRSFSSCNDLGWSNTLTYGSSLICGESDNALGGCSGDLTWCSALHFCESSGARLCSLMELQNDETSGSGCTFDVEQVWTATSCGAGSYSTAMGSASAGATTQCLADDEVTTAKARCCADTIAATHAPSPIPTIVPTVRVIWQPDSVCAAFLFQCPFVGVPHSTRLPRLQRVESARWNPRKNLCERKK